MIRRAPWIIAAALFLWTPVHAQDNSPATLNTGAEPQLIVEALTFASRDSGKTRIDIFLQVTFESLSFVKEGETYGASYEVTAMLDDSAGTQVAEQTWTETIAGLTFDQTVTGGAVKISQRSFTVSPGRYSLSLQVRDADTKKSRKIQRSFIVPSYWRSGLSMSSIMLLSRLVEQGGKKHIVPSVSENMGLVPNAFHIFYEVYNHGAPDSVRFSASILGQKNQELLKIDTVAFIDAGRTEMFMRIDNSTLVVGDYTLMVVAASTHGSAVLAEVARPFVIRWRGMPMSVNSLDAAIDQLKYIARDAEYDSLREATTTEEKQRLFLAFWKKRDPNPNTPRNERMEEYYNRIDFANKHFSHYRAGWKSDMGLVYIVLGPPGYVDRHPFDMDSKPYEVWSYYDINQSFVFVDETGFGDYRLVTPISEVYRYSQWK